MRCRHVIIFFIFFLINIITEHFAGFTFHVVVLNFNYVRPARRMILRRRGAYQSQSNCALVRRVVCPGYARAGG